MKRIQIIKNNKGAALVMVIVAMLFVGIIAAIALTLTVGNSKSTKATIDTSKNFYSSESILNDLEMYLKKFATDCATEAYADILGEIESGSDLDDDEAFGKKFAVYINEKLTNSTDGVFKDLTLDSSDPENKGYVLTLDLLQKICYTRNDIDKVTDLANSPIKIKYGEIVPGYTTTDGVNYVKNGDGRTYLKNVVITLNIDGYESTITTDIVFDAKMPRTGTLDSSDDFTYDIDHFIIMAGKDIVAQNGSMGGVRDNGAGSYRSTEYIGNIYAYNNLLIRTDEAMPVIKDGKITERIPAAKFKSYYVIAGNNIIVDRSNGASDLDGNDSIDGSVAFEPINNDRIVSRAGSTKFGANIWTDNFKVFDGSVKLNGVEDKNLETDTYLGGNLELNGNNSEFIFEKGTGKLNGYSYKSTTNGMVASLTAPKSSAIILNGLGARLDLSKLKELNLSGTAYTAISDLMNVYDMYSSYSDTDANLNFYTQGESITYRAMQALYLVPGSMIKKVGHNPMTVQDILDATNRSSITSLDLYGLQVTPPEILKPYIKENDPYIAQYVRYVGNDSTQSADDKVYLFWNFNSKADAVAYFNKVVTANEEKDFDNLYNGQGLSTKQIKMLYTDKNGYIRLPEAKYCSLYGNGIYYDETAKKLAEVKGNGLVTTNYDKQFGSLKATVESDRNDNGKNLIENMLGDNLTKAGGTQNELPLYMPLDTRYDAEGNLLTFEFRDITKYKDENGNLLAKQYKYAEIDPSYSNLNQKNLDTKTYRLITGDNIKLENLNTSYTYIVITPGNVEFIAHPSKFRGMIIAGGSVSIPDDMDMECLGMFSYDMYKNGVLEKEEDTSEFRALLDVVWYEEGTSNEDRSTGNFKLREIFNVADTSTTGGSGNSDDFVTIKTKEWKRN